MAKNNDQKINDSANAALTKETAVALNQAKAEKKVVNEFVVAASYLRIAPRKIRLVANLLKGLTLIAAEEQLSFLPQKAVVYLKKLLKNAAATGAHNYNLAKEDLYIKNVLINQGPTLHRFKPAAYGMAHPIRKRSTNLQIIIAKKNAAAEPPVKKNIFNKLIGKKRQPIIKKEQIKKITK